MPVWVDKEEIICKTNLARRYIIGYNLVQYMIYLNFVQYDQLYTKYGSEFLYMLNFEILMLNSIVLRIIHSIVHMKGWTILRYIEFVYNIYICNYTHLSVILRLNLAAESCWRPQHKFRLTIILVSKIGDGLHEIQTNSG